MADTSEVTDSFEWSRSPKESEATLKDSNANTSLCSSAPSSSHSLGQGRSGNHETGKPVIHLLGGSYVLDLNLNGRIARKIARKEEKERKKVAAGSNTPTIFELSPTVGNWKDCTKIISINSNEQDGTSCKEGLTKLVALSTVFSMVTYLGDLVSDLATTYVLYSNGHLLWSAVSLLITVLPLVAVNVVSLIWYCEDKLYHGRGWLIRVLSHACGCGVLCRYADILISGYCANRARRRRTLFGNHYSVLYLEQRRIAATLNLIECFLQDAPQFSLQVYIWTVENRMSSRMLLEKRHVIQFISIAFSLLTLCYSIVSFHQALRFTKRHVIPMSFLGCVAQFIWRLGTTGSRILAIMFALSSFPTVTVIMVLLHWIFMMFWLQHQQSSTTTLFAVAPLSNMNQLLYEILLAGVHVFCYLNLFENELGYRLIFYYGLQLLEDVFFILLWYSELFLGLANYEPWIYSTGIIIYFNAFFTGLFAMMVFYAKLHPAMVISCPHPEQPVMPLSTLISESFVTKLKSNFHLPALKSLKGARKGKYSLENEILQPSLDDFQFHDTASDRLLTITPVLIK